MKRFSVFAAFSAAVPYVVAHGFVSQVAIDGQAYAGNVPNEYKGVYSFRKTFASQKTGWVDEEMHTNRLILGSAFRCLFGTRTSVQSINRFSYDAPRLGPIYLKSLYLH